jgi:hypothetical protein
LRATNELVVRCCGQQKLGNIAVKRTSTTNVQTFSNSTNTVIKIGLLVDSQKIDYQHHVPLMGRVEH